jgi:peptidoglycan-associated lipoprotein
MSKQNNTCQIQEGGIPSLADPTPPKSVYPFITVSPYISYPVLGLVLACVIYMAVSCNKRTVTWEQPIDEPEQAQVVQTFSEEDDPPALVQDCAGIDGGRLYFGFDRSGVEGEGVKVVEVLAGRARGCAGEIVVIGYCDERGSREYNQGLGQRRAGAVKAGLVGRGIDGGRVQIVSYGEDSLAVEGCRDEGCHEKNRRVEFQLEGVK